MFKQIAVVTVQHLRETNSRVWSLKEKEEISTCYFVVNSGELIFSSWANPRDYQTQPDRTPCKNLCGRRLRSSGFIGGSHPRYKLPVFEHDRAQVRAYAHQSLTETEVDCLVRPPSEWYKCSPEGRYSLQPVDWILTVLWCLRQSAKVLSWLSSIKDTASQERFFSCNLYCGEGLTNHS